MDRKPPSFNAHTVTLANGDKTQCLGRTDDEVLDDLRRFNEKYGHAPTYQDFDIAGSFGENYAAEIMCRHFNKTWNELLEMAGLEINHSYNKQDEDTLLANLRSLYERLQRPLVKSDIESGGGDDFTMASPATYHRTFGTFSQACEAAGVPCRHSATEKMMLEVIAKYYKEFGEPPLARDFSKSDVYNGNKTANTYIKRFGSWSGAVELAIQLAMSQQEEPDDVSNRVDLDVGETV